MKDESYVRYLEKIVDALLKERGHDGDIHGENVTDNSPGTYAVYNIRQTMSEKQSQRGEQTMREILEAIIEAGGDPIRVGGCIRDEMLGVESKDIDIEVFGLSSDALVAVLKRFGKVSVVGESFGVIKLRHKGEEFDFSLPRRDNKVGRGHKGFEVVVDHELSPFEAAKRRDFTINAIGRRLDGELVDPHGGLSDLNNRVLRHTSEHFAEDPLRVLRGFQFAARFNMSVVPETLEMCRSLIGEFDTLAIERIWIEFEKWAVKGSVPSAGLRFLRACGWVSLFPELEALIGVQQDPEWHPEGDVWEHTLHVCDAAARIADREQLEGEDRAVLILAALCHDLGKPETSVFERGRWRAPGHPEAGVPVAKRFLESIGCLQRIIDRVLPLVREHMIHVTGGQPSDKLVRRLAVRLEKASVCELLLLIEADHSGRPPLFPGLPKKAEEIGVIAERLDVEAAKPKPIIGGRHLIDRGLQPGPRFGEIIGECFEAQLDGVFVDENGAVLFLEELLQ